MLETAVEFTPFPKMARLSRDMLVTEKIDGTSGCIYVGADGEFNVGSRTRWITPEQDNHGFARWAYDHKDELVTGLGPGRHFGEWWGSGIQRGYGLSKGEKHFSLFNVQRWCLHGEEPQRIITGDPRQEKYQEALPACVGLVPILYRGLFDLREVDSCLLLLEQHGSWAVKGFMNPEGVVVFHVAANICFKKTLKHDELPKSLAKS
jgi:hypothetical protein